MSSELKIVVRRDGWWIVTDDDPETDCGPYETKAEAEDSRVRIKRFLKYQDEPGYVTSDSLRKSKKK